MTTRNLGRAEQERYIKELEAQGCKVRYGGRGSKLVVYAPDGGSTTIHFTTSDIRSLQASISWFRRHGLRHPDDTKEVRVDKPECTHESWEEFGGGARKCADCGEHLPAVDPYPDYVKAKLSNTIRTKALALLRDQGWPSEVTVKSLPGMDPSTAAKALYAIGYRWPEGMASGQTGPKARVWHAPEDIRKLAAADAANAEVQKPEVRQVQQFVTPPSPADVARAVANSEKRETAWDQPTPPRVESHAAEAERLLEEMPRPRPTAPEVAKPEPEVPEEREFIDTADSWVVDTNAWDSRVPAAVMEYLDILRTAGLEVEIRVWRKDH